MQSLRIFMEEKGSKFGVRTSLEHSAGIEKIKIIPLTLLGKSIQLHSFSPIKTIICIYSMVSVSAYKNVNYIYGEINLTIKTIFLNQLGYGKIIYQKEV